MNLYKFLFVMPLFIFLVHCRPKPETLSPEQYQEQIENEVIGLNKIELGPYHKFSSQPAIDPSTGDTCMSYRFSFKMNSLNSVDQFILESFSLDQKCSYTLSEMSLVGRGQFVNNETKLLESRLTDADVISRFDFVTESFNKNKSCGLNNWVTNQRKSVLNSDCIRSRQGRLYFGLNNDILIIHSCNDGEALNANCKRIVLNRM